MLPPAKTSVALRCQEKPLSFSFSNLRGYVEPKPRGVPMGVVSAVDERPGSLNTGEKCKGGGVARESSFTLILWRVEGVFGVEAVGGPWLQKAITGKEDKMSVAAQIYEGR